MSYLLFYSNYCKHSKLFINFLEQSGYSHNFNKICVDRDSSGKRPKIITQYNISRIPSIIINGDLLTDINAFKWLDTKINNIESVPRPNDPMPSRMNKIENIKDYSDNKVLLPYDGEGGVNNITDNCVSVSNNHDSFIEYPEDNGEFITDRHNPGFIMKDDNLHLIDAEMVSDKRMHTSTKKDTLKLKQYNNEYEKILAERKQTEPKHARRI